MAVNDQPVSILAEDECWELLSSAALGRLVTCVGSHPEIFPVNFVVQRPTVLFGLPRVFRTADFVSIYAASCEFRYSARTSCGVR